MKPYTPLHGPLAGVPCRRSADGALEPIGPVDSANARPAVVVPQEFGRDDAVDREVVDRMTGQQVRAGFTPERAKEIAVTAALRNAHGQMGRPYTPRS